jgi:hypothetical protein
VLNTLEYQNAVAVEGTPTLLQSFAAEANLAYTPGQLVIEGFHLDQAWLTQIVMAST